MPINNALAQRPANMLAYQDTLSATQRNEYLGALADLIAQSYSPQRTQQMQGTARFLSMPAISQTLDRLSYGEPLTTGAGGLGGTTRIRPEALEAAMAVAPVAQPATMATLQAARAARQAALTGKVLPVGLSTEAVGGMGFLRPNVAPQEEALRLAQQRAALPISKGGLGLPANNTAADRAKAMGGIDAVHFSRRGGDYTTLDSGQFAVAPFDAVGTHVGTPQAAMERFENTVGYKVNNPNYALDELTGSTYPVKVLGKKPLLNQNEMPWGEDDLNTFLRKTGGHNYSDINGGKLTYQDLNADLRKKLFNQQGYTSIPYFNEVEGKGSISYIVPPENLRSQFAAFDPFRRSAAIAASMGVAAPDLLASETNDDINKMRKLKANSK
jgi:hypothetical protein